MQTAWQKLEALDKLLDAFSMTKESVLARGYALVHAGDKVVAKAGEVPSGGALEIEFADGRVCLRWPGPARSARSDLAGAPRRRTPVKARCSTPKKIELVQLGGLEPPTSGATIRRSNQLSYSCLMCRGR